MLLAIVMVVGLVPGFTVTASAGIVEGYNNTFFGPNDPITREQLVTILYRYEQYKGGGFTGAWMSLLDYADMDKFSACAYKAMCWTTMHGEGRWHPRSQGQCQALPSSTDADELSK